MLYFNENLMINVFPSIHLNGGASFVDFLYHFIKTLQLQMTSIFFLANVLKKKKYNLVEDKM